MYSNSVIIKTVTFPSLPSLSFQIYSIFTNVPLAETINVSTDRMYDSDLVPPSLLRDDFVNLMHLTTSSVEFIFNHDMYWKIDRIAMGLPLGPALAKIFVGYIEVNQFCDM